ncbi:MAG TPA: carboxypeptidase-like regulatory domain-containing protein [Myxococcota bacterium]|nr:carboxypeptidase-like regulatory domain-containing protein [Myxococcota bacterium]HRY97058.1 carboxypeptidase-like regulatory domain-containing protein [Myxococcota bacterium]HSA20977.1 carboxypeptidase-like regulatory domain-containing protein [Myxococcota bacterium]
MRRKTDTARILLALVGALAAPWADGCGLMIPAGETCFDSLDCAQGWRCNLDTYRCEPIPNSEDVIHLELRPPQGASSADTQATVDLSDPGVDSQALSLELEPAVVLQGQVPSPFAAGGVAGTAVATREPGFDDRSLTWSVQVPSDGLFALNPAPGLYALLFRPSNRDEFPQLRYEAVALSADAPRSLDLSYPGPYPSPDELGQQTELLLVKVQVLQSEGLPLPVPGMQVEGTTDQGLRTNVATPDAQGVAYLRLPLVRRQVSGDRWSWIRPTSLDLSLRPAAAGMRLPTVSIPGLPLDAPDLGSFYVGDLPPSRALSGRVLTVRGEPVPGCRLQFLLEQLGQGSLREVVEADVEGAFATTLPEGTYQVRAVPPVASAASITTSTLELLADTSQVVIAVDERPWVTGTIRDQQGQAVPDVTLVASRTSDWSGLDDGALRSYDGMSDSQGAFSLRLDPGQYDLTLVPSAATGLPRHTLRHVFVTVDLSLADADTTLPAPGVVRGHVFNSVGEPQCGITLDVFRADDEGAWLVGQAVSGNSTKDGCSGSFSVVLPVREAP